MRRTAAPVLLVVALGLASCAPSTRFSCENPTGNTCDDFPVGYSDDDVRAACATWSTSVLYAEPCRHGDATCTVTQPDGRVNVWHFYDPYPRDEARDLCFIAAETGASVSFEER
jgi:hypothetical protein